MKKILALVIGSLLSLIGSAYACCEEGNYRSSNAWLIDGAFGLALYPDTLNQDGQTAAGRLSLGYKLLDETNWNLSLEAGLQSGNTMRLALPKEAIDALGGVPIEAEMKPLLDLLIGLNVLPLADFPIVAWMKGGVAYRQLQLDRESIPDLSRIAPEIQAGLGYQLSQQVTLNLGYQYIWGNKPELTIDPLTETGFLHNIPSQQAVMIGFSFSF